MNDLRSAAVDYAKRGWRTIPLYNVKTDGSCACGRPDCDGNSRGKHPRITQWQEKATNDIKKIEYWWGMWPQSNVGVMCGQETGFMVVDVDGPTGEESLRGRDWPKTHKVKTGRGCHYHFKWPGLDFTLKNNAGILPGIDVKVGKGQVAMPPSTHYNGSIYEWEVGPDECEIAEAPAWFVEILKEKYGPKKRLEENVKKLENNRKQSINNRYAIKAFEEEVAAVAFASEGSRNSQLNTSAFKLATLVGSGNLDEWDVRRQLAHAGRRAGLGDAEVEATLNSAMGAGKKHKREIPDPKSTMSFKKLKKTASMEGPKEEEKEVPRKRYYTLNNRGNVERLLDLHRGDLKYVREFKDWITWTGKNWARDETAAYSALDDIIVNLYEETKDCKNDDTRKKLAMFAASCGNNNSYSATATLAAKNPGFSISVLELDSDDCKLNLQNGVLSLDDFELLPHNPSFRLMKIAGYGFDENAKCERWEKFLEEVFAGNIGIIEYIQRVIGYSLTGSMAEKCFFFLHGAEGDNGKSVFLELMRELGGEYAKNADISTFLISKNDRVRDDLAALYGARIITTAEPEEGSRFAMSVIKPWTGGDPQTCRELYGKIFTYQPKGKIFLAANNKPAIYERTNAAWSRVHLISFNVTFSKENQDKYLINKLKDELPGILNWAIEGLKDYRTLGGLYPPKEISEAVAAYRKENDSVRTFVEEICVLDKEGSVDGPQIYIAYKEFCLNSGLKPLGLGKFNGAMLEACVLKGVVRERRTVGYIWRGIRSPSPNYYRRGEYA